MGTNTALAISSYSGDERLIALRAALGDSVWSSWFAILNPESAGENLVMFPSSKFMADYVARTYGEKIREFFNSYEFIYGGRNSAVVAPLSETANQNLVDTATVGARRVISDLNLNNAFSFDSFFISTANTFSVAACKKICADPHAGFSLLFLHGTTGCGKTHLLQSCAREISARGDRRVVYMTASQFAQKFARAAMNRDFMTFKSELRDCEVLCLDGIESLASREKTISEMFQTITDLLNDGRAVIISSLHAPSNLNGFPRAVQSVLSSGLTLEIESPVSHTTEIMKLRGLSPALADALGDMTFDCGHSLMGAVQTLNAYASISGESLTANAARPLIRGCATMTPADFVRKMADRLHISIDEISSPSRRRPTVRARQMISFCLRESLHLSLPEIGRLLGGRDHTTIMYGLEQITTARGADLTLDIELRELCALHSA